MAAPRAVLTDIEGTTSSIAFVKDTLFPYAQKQLEPFLAAHAAKPEIAALLTEVLTLAAQEIPPAPELAALAKQKPAAQPAADAAAAKPPEASPAAPAPADAPKPDTAKPAATTADVATAAETTAIVARPGVTSPTAATPAATPSQTAAAGMPPAKPAADGAATKEPAKAAAQDAPSDAAPQPAPPPDIPTATAILRRWMEADSKATPLKTLQGLIWAQGYEQGALKGHLWPDVAPCLRGWADGGIALYVYSSGSEAAQRLIFGHSLAGDLAPLFKGFFDTRVGAKREKASYEAITQRIGMPAGDILFLSDIPAELEAAKAAGLRTCQLVRPEDGTKGTLDHMMAGSFHAVARGFSLPLPGGGEPSL